MARLSTVAAFGFADFDPPVVLDLYRRLGCTSCQFYRNEQNPPTPAEVKTITSDVGLPIDSIHGVFGEAYDPASPNETLRRRTMDVYRREAELARELVQTGGRAMVVVHPSAPIPEGMRPTDEQRRARLTPLRRSLPELAEIGREAGVVILIENVPWNCWCGQDIAELAQMIAEVDSPNLKMCFDTGHALMTGTVSDRLAAVAEQIGYLHVHDNDGKIDDHRMPGDGVIDWERFREAVQSVDEQMPAMLEVFYLADRLRECISEGLGERLAHWLAVPRQAGNAAG